MSGKKMRTKLTVSDVTFDLSNEKPEPNPIIPEIIRLRTEEGWSLDKLAHKYGMSRTKVQRLLWDNDQDGGGGLMQSFEAYRDQGISEVADTTFRLLGNGYSDKEVMDFLWLAREFAANPTHLKGRQLRRVIFKYKNIGRSNTPIG